MQKEKKLGVHDLAYCLMTGSLSHWREVTSWDFKKIIIKEGKHFAEITFDKRSKLLLGPLKGNLKKRFENQVKVRAIAKELRKKKYKDIFNTVKEV